MVHKSIRKSQELLWLLEAKLTNLSKAKFVEMLVSGSTTMRAYGAEKDRIELVPQGNETLADIKERANAISTSNFVAELGSPSTALELPNGIKLTGMHSPGANLSKSGTFNTFAFEFDLPEYKPETFFVVLRYQTARGAAGAAAQKNFADCLTTFLTGNGATAVTVESNKEGQQNTDVVAQYTMGSAQYKINFEVKSLEKGSTVSFFDKTHIKDLSKAKNSHREADKLAVALLGTGGELRNIKSVFFSGDPLPTPSTGNAGQAGRIDDLEITNTSDLVNELRKHWVDNKDDFFVISNDKKYTIFSTSDQPKKFPGFSMSVFPKFTVLDTQGAKFGTFGAVRRPGLVRAAIKIDVKLLNNFDCNLKLGEDVTRTESSAVAGGAISGVQAPLDRCLNGKPASGDSKSKKKILSKNAKAQCQSLTDARLINEIKSINETRDLLRELLYEEMAITISTPVR